MHILLNFKPFLSICLTQENHDSSWLTLKSWEAEKEKTEASYLIYMTFDKGNLPGSTKWMPPLSPLNLNQAEKESTCQT